MHKNISFIYIFKTLKVKVIIFPVPIILVSPYSNHEMKKSERNTIVKYALIVVR
jgi:hypothetical protein